MIGSVGWTGSVTESYSRSFIQFVLPATIHYSGDPLFPGGRRQWLWQSIGDFGEYGKFFRQIRAQPLAIKTPTPVPFLAAGHVHPGVAAKIQCVLQRHHAEARDRTRGSANHRPLDAVFTS